MKSVEYQVKNWVKRPLSVDDFFISPMVEDQIKALQVDDSALFSKPDDKGNSAVPLFQLRGIPLSHQWLTRLGFSDTSDEKTASWQRVSAGKLLFNILKPHSNGQIFSINYKQTQIPIQFVHQLQNLYKSLTGEELQ